MPCIKFDKPLVVNSNQKEAKIRSLSHLKVTKQNLVALAVWVSLIDDRAS